MRCVGDRILGEEEVRQCLGLDARFERIGAHRAVDAEEAADAVEREPGDQLDRRERRVDHRNHRVARSRGQFRGDEAERLQLERLIAELQHARVLRSRLVVRQESAAS